MRRCRALFISLSLTPLPRSPCQVMIAMILVRALRKDIAQYNDASIEEAKEESGWKLVHGDVFRPPSSYPMVM